MNVCMYVCMPLCLYICMSVCMYVCIYVCIYVYVCMYVCMHACMYACMYLYLFVVGWVARRTTRTSPPKPSQPPPQNVNVYSWGLFGCGWGYGRASRDPHPAQKQVTRYQHFQTVVWCLFVCVCAGCGSRDARPALVRRSRQADTYMYTLLGSWMNECVGSWVLHRQSGFLKLPKLRNTVLSTRFLTS